MIFTTLDLIAKGKEYESYSDMPAGRLLFRDSQSSSSPICNRNIYRYMIHNSIIAGCDALLSAKPMFNNGLTPAFPGAHAFREQVARCLQSSA